MWPIILSTLVRMAMEEVRAWGSALSGELAISLAARRSWPFELLQLLTYADGKKTTSRTNELLSSLKLQLHSFVVPQVNNIRQDDPPPPLHNQIMVSCHSTHFAIPFVNKRIREGAPRPANLAT